MLVARASLACSASTSLRFCAWNTRRTIASASGEVIAQHGAADLDDREARRVQLREALEVLVDFLGAAHARQQPHDGLAGLRIVHGMRVQHRAHGVSLPRMRVMVSV